MEINAETGELNDGWQSELPEELQADETLNNIRDIPSMAKMLVNAQKMVGKDKVVLPGADATPEDYQSFYRSLGVPDSPDKYGLKKPEDFPEDMPFDEAQVKEYAEVAHKNGLMPSQVKALYDWYNEKTQTTYKNVSLAEADAREKAEQVLKDEWGEQYSELLNKAQKAIAAYIPQEERDFLKRPEIGNNPIIIKALAKVGEGLSEDQLALSDEPDTGASAQAEINRIMGDPNHAYHNKSAPGHRAAVNEVADLYKRIYPTAK